MFPICFLFSILLTDDSHGAKLSIHQFHLLLFLPVPLEIEAQPSDMKIWEIECWCGREKELRIVGAECEVGKLRFVCSQFNDITTHIYPSPSVGNRTGLNSQF